MQGVLEKRLSTYHSITLEEFVEQLAGADPEDVFIIETPWIVLDMEAQPVPQVMCNISYYFQCDPERPGHFTIERPYCENRHVTLEEARAIIAKFAEHAQRERQRLDYVRAW